MIAIMKCMQGKTGTARRQDVAGILCRIGKHKDEI